MGNTNVTLRDSIIKKLETLDKLDKLEVVVEVQGVDETATVTGDYLNCPFTMDFDTTWNTIVYNKTMAVSEIIDLLKSKSLDEMTINDIEGEYDFYLSDYAGMGEINVIDLVWKDKKPSDEELEDLDTIDLYTDGQIDNAEYSSVGVYSIKIESKELGFSECYS